MKPRTEPGAGSHASHYTALQEFLAPWSVLWGHSVFHRSGEPGEPSDMERLVPESWFHYGATRDLANQFQLAQGEQDGLAPASLLELVRRLRELCELPKLTIAHALRALLGRGLTPKKKHEIEAVVSLFRQRGVSASRVLDIGGGIGHLARHIALELDCPVDTVDRDHALQKKGMRVLGREPWRRRLKHPVRFVLGEFPGIENPSPDQQGGAWAIGLHTCAELAWCQLELVRSGYSVLNIGCCYEKLDAVSGTHRSRHGKARPLLITEEALFLANRGGVERSPEDFIFQQRVQRYRFSLHELLLREGCHPALAEAVGSASVSAYSGSFFDYVRDRLGTLQGAPASVISLSSAACEEAYRSMAPGIERKRFLAFLRNLFARPLEVALLLDRALFVEEGAGAHDRQGYMEYPEYDVRLIQLFDARISPRNIALLVEKAEVPGVYI